MSPLAAFSTIKMKGGFFAVIENTETTVYDKIPSVSHLDSTFHISHSRSLHTYSNSYSEYMIQVLYDV